MNVSIEKKKAEAVKRMRKLGIFGPTIKQFEKEDLVSISEPPAGAFFWVEGDELEEMREWEKKHNALVYVIVRSYTTLGKMDAYIYVSDYEEEWQEDNECLKEGEVLAYVINRSMPDCSEFGSIGVKRTIAAGLARV